MMYGDNGILVDVQQIGKIVEDSDVFALGFANISERLLVDVRSNDRETALIQIVEPAGSGSERREWLRRRRPSLGPVESLFFIGWPHSPGFLVQSGVWDRICTRVGAAAEPEVRSQCDLALRQLQNLDLSATQAILRGERSVNLWPRTEVPERPPS
jgi:hypothetical protein